MYGALVYRQHTFDFAMAFLHFTEIDRDGFENNKSVLTFTFISSRIIYCWMHFHVKEV